MNLEYIKKTIQAANHNIIETYNYFAHYRYENINEYLDKSLKSAIKANEIIINIIENLKEVKKKVIERNKEEYHE